MAFFRQLRLLLWKNGLAVIRQPLWSLTLLAWPLIIFFIILVTRHQFPPIVKETCYVSPRNLPSAGFFPFLQTLMCDTDSTCRNTSRLVDPTGTKSFQTSSANLRSGVLGKSFPLADLFQGGNFFNLSLNSDSSVDHAQVATVFKEILGSSFQKSLNNVSLGIDNGTLLEDQETLNNVLDSANVVKKVVCTTALPMINSTSSHPLSYALGTFCRSNSTVFEVSLLTLNQMLTDLLLTKPNETVATAETSVLLFNQLQNQTSLWEGLLAIPQLLSSSSDQVLNGTKSLFTSFQGAVDVFQNSFPEANISLSNVHPLLAGGINTIHYVQNWPGKDVSIPLAEIVTLQNDSVSGIMKRVLQEVHIPLHKTIGLALDKNLVNAYLCDNSSSASLVLAVACSTGTVGKLLEWISPDLAAQQALLAWSKDVAPHDVSFIKGMLSSLTGGSPSGGQGGSNGARKRRSVDTQAQSVEQQLFLSLGEVVMEILQMYPSAEAMVQRILSTGFQSMKSVTTALDTAAEMMEGGLSDADQLQLSFLTLLTNETQASIWIDRVLDSGMQTVMKTLTSESSSCEDLLGPFEWLLKTESINVEAWRSMICRNNFTLQQALLADWWPLVQEVQDVYTNLTEQADYNATLPMILAEWQKFANSSLEFGTLLERLYTELDGEYWMNWMPDNNTVDVYETLLQSGRLFMETFGENIETSDLWPKVKDYFHMTFWILNYRPGVTAQPANCSLNSSTLAINCNSGLNWTQFIEAVSESLMSPNEALVNALEGTLNVLQNVYGDFYKNLTFFKEYTGSGDELSAGLDGFFQNISILPYCNVSNPDIVHPPLWKLLDPTGLSPLLTLFLSEAPLNVSTLLNTASKQGRLYQPIFASNETDPTMLELEQLIMQFLSMESNLTLPISHVMGYSLLNYSEYLNNVTRFRESIRPFANQTSAGDPVEAILGAIELWRTVMTSPNVDQANITLTYIRQLKKVTMSLLKFQEINSVMLPNGQLNVTQFNQLSEDIITFLSAENLQSLTQAGPDAAQGIVFEKVLSFLPPGLKMEATGILQEFRSLVYEMSECAAGQNCLDEILEIFTLLNQISDIMISPNSNFTIKITGNNSVVNQLEFDEITPILFSHLLPSNNYSNMEMSNQILQFIKLIMATPNISVSEIQNALEQSNLTLEVLNNIAELTHDVNISKLLDSVMEFINISQCFETQQNPAATAKCFTGLMNRISSFVMELPDFCNETTLLSLIPLVINKTISDMAQVNFSCSPNLVVFHTLSSTLADIKTNLQLNQMNTTEVMSELKMLENLMSLLANPQALDFNSTSKMDPIYAQRVYLEMAELYLRRLDNINRTSRCAAGQKCSTGISEIFKLLKQISDITISPNSNVTIRISGNNSVLNGLEFDEITPILFSLLLPSNNYSNMEMSNQILQFIKLIMATPNISVSEIQNALEQSNLTLEVLNNIAELTHDVNVSKLLDSVMEFINISQCFETQQNPAATAKCFTGLMNRISSFVMELPDFCNETTLLSLIPLVINKTISDMAQVNFSCSPNLVVFHTLSSTLADIRMNLQLNQMNTTEVMSDLENVEDLISLLAHTKPLDFNSTSKMDPIYGQKVYLEMAELYLRRLENINQTSRCAAGQKCSTGISEIFTLLKQISDIMISPNSNVTIRISGNNSVLNGLEFDEITPILFSLLLGSNNYSNMEMLNQTLPFIKLIMATPNISVSEIQNALEQSNLTLEVLNNIAELTHDVNISKLLDSVMEFINVSQCFETQLDQAVTAECVTGLMDRISSFVMELPDFCNETTLLSLIPLVINKTISDMAQVNFSCSPNVTLIHTLSSTLADIRTNLQLNQMNTTEVMSELKMLENLMSLLANPQALDFNSTLTMDPIYAQRVYLDIMNWYLVRLENMTSNSSISELLFPFFHLTQMQITLQLAQTDFTVFVSNQFKSLMNSLQYPIDGAGVGKIGEAAAKIFEHLFDFINSELQVQNSSFNTTILNATELPIMQYFDLMVKWMTQPNISLALTSMLNWRNSSMNVSTHVTDIQHLLKTLDRFLSDDQLAYMSVINNITQSLSNALMLAELPGGLQSDDFLDAILEAVENAMQIPTGVTDALPVSTRDDIREVLRDSLEVVVEPGMSFSSARNISLFILKIAESVIEHTANNMYSEYVEYGLKAVTRYLETISTADDNWTQVFWNEMRAVQRFLPPNSTAQSCVSALINITYLTLESEQGDVSFWSTFENATAANTSLITGQMSKALRLLWPLVTEDLGLLGLKAPSLEGFAYLAPALENVMTGQADKDTWDQLKQMLDTLLPAFPETELWDNVSSAIPPFETIIGTMVNIAQAENAMILSLQMPLLTLMTETAQSVNSTRFNLSDISARMQLAAKSMANGTLRCDEVLREWEPVRQAAGLSRDAVASWCNIKLQPVLEAYAAAQTVYPHLNMSHMGVGPVNGSDAAARIVNTLQSLYQVGVNRTLVTEQLIRAFSNQLSVLASQPLSPEAQLYWNTQLQDMQFLNSLSTITFLSDELLSMVPFLRPYIKAMEKALHYTLNNLYPMQNTRSSNELFGEAAMIFLTSVNTTLDNMFSMIWGNTSGLNESAAIEMMRDALKLLSDWQVFNDAPVISQGLEQFLASNDKRVILETIADISSWLASPEANITSDKIFSMIWGNWSGLNETSLCEMMREAVKMLNDWQVFQDANLDSQALEQFLASNDTRMILQAIVDISTWLAFPEANITSDNSYSMIWGNWSGLSETSLSEMLRDAVNLLSDQKIFGDEPEIYQELEQFMAFDDTGAILQAVADISTRLASTQANITSDNIFSMMWGNWSGLNETSLPKMFREAVKLLNDKQILAYKPLIYQALARLLATNDTRMIAHSGLEISTWLASIEANITSDNLFSMMWGDLCGLTDFTDMLRDTAKLMSDLHIFGDTPMIYRALDDFVTFNDTTLFAEKVAEMFTWLVYTEANITSDDLISMMWGPVSGQNETHFTNIIRGTVKMLSDLQIFGDQPMVYQDLEQFLAPSNTSLVVKKMVEIIAWLASPFGPANITSDNVFSMVWGNVSGPNETFYADMTREGIRLMSVLQIFGDAPLVYQILESNDTDSIVQKVAELSAWLTSTEASGLDLLTQTLPKMYDIIRPLISILTQMNMGMQEYVGLFEELAGNIVTMLGQLEGTGGLPTPVVQDLGMFQQQTMGSNYSRVRQRRGAPLMLMTNPMEDFINLFYINYTAMFEALSVPPTTEEMIETMHMFFNNPDLNVVLKGASKDIPWGLNASREDTIEAALEVLSFLTLPNAFQESVLGILGNATDKIPDGFPFSSVLRNITGALVNESEDLMYQINQTAAQLLQINLTNPRITEHLGLLRAQVCGLENTQTVRQLMQSLSVQPGQLCDTFLPSLEVLVESVYMNVTSLTDAVFQSVVGDPRTYNVQPTWTSVLNKDMGVNITSLANSLKFNISSPGKVTIGELLRNQTAFVLDVDQRMTFDPAVLGLLLETTLPNNNMEILSWLLDPHRCDPTAYTNASDVIVLETFCSMSAEQWYTFSLLAARQVNIEKVFYRVALTEDIQGLLDFMIQMAKYLADKMDEILPAIGQLENIMRSIEDLNLIADNEFKQMTRRRRSTSSKATFATLSRAMCSSDIKALFNIIKPQGLLWTDSSDTTQQKEDLIDRFKIPRNATPFCTNLYQDMVSTRDGAIAWAFLKPMLMGQILYTPDTPVTRAIMEKANATLQEFANLRQNSKEWLQDSNYIMMSSQILGSTLPMLQNSLANSFVKTFIEMQTDIDVDSMRETLSNFSNVAAMLEKNKDIMSQITTLSNLMVNLSSCVKFDRYRGFDSADELNAVAQQLAKNRDLYASVIFKLPGGRNSSTSRPARAAFTSALPPRVSYTIRMHMDNVMRTDRVREPYFVKDAHISVRQAIRYSRGFIYLQESIDRAVIEAQVGQKVTEPAVQLQPFPYPCFQRDEFLQAISYVFPIMLMIAWVLFVADFVRKLVHERELRLHEYMKMMGVNPLSHFFAWFLDCAAHLMFTIVVLTLVLKVGKILPNSDGFLLFLYLCDYGLSILAFSYLVSSLFDKTYIAGLSGSLLYILCFFPYIMVIALETNLTLSQKSALSLFAPTCFSYASQYVSRYETQGEGIHWSNSYTSPIIGDTTSFGWLCWLMLIDSILYFIIGAYIRMVFPGKYGIPSPWYFPFTASFWSSLCCRVKSERKAGKGLLITNILQRDFPDAKVKGQSILPTAAGEDYSDLPVGVSLHGLSKLYGNRAAIENLNVSFYEGHVTSLLGHNGAGKTTTMSLLTGLFPPSSGTIEVYGRDMQAHLDGVRSELGVCMQYDVLFDHLTTKEHLLLYGQIKAPHWSPGELHEQVRSILEETGMHAHRHKPVGTLSGGMRRKLSISIAFIGGSRLVVLDEPTTGVDPCSRRSIWDIVIQNKKHRTIIMSTHHLDEAEVLSDRIAFLERGGLKCCGSPFHLKDKLGQGYKLTLTKKPQMQSVESERVDNAELKAFVQAHIPEARLKEAQGGDVVYSLPPFTSSSASSYRSLLTALDSNLDALQLRSYGISDTTLEEVFLQLTCENAEAQGSALSISETVSDTASLDSFSSDLSDNIPNFGDRIKLTGSSAVRGLALAWQQMVAILIKRFHHSRRDWKGLISQIVIPVLFMVFAMCLGKIKSELRNYPDLELSPALYKIGPSYSFFRNLNPNSSQLVDAMTSFPGIDNACLDNSDNPVCKRSPSYWTQSRNSSRPFGICRCTRRDQICDGGGSRLPHMQIPSSQIVYNLTGFNAETYLIATANDYIRNRYGGFDFGMPLPSDLKMDLRAVPMNRTLSKVWFNPEGYHTMPAYLNSLSNFILRSNLPADKDPGKYAISVSSHPYFGRADDDDIVVQGMLQILVAVCVLTGYSITTTSFAIYEVKEHHSGSKRLQHIAGISEPFYWAVNFFYDMVVYMIPVTLTVAVIAAFQIPAFTDRQNLAAIALLLFLFGFATFPWMYLLSEVFKDAEMAFITYVCINLFISVNTIMSTSILFFLSQITTRNPELIQAAFNKLSQAFLIFPQFNFGNGLMELARMNIQVQLLSGYGIDAYKNPFSTDCLGWMFIASFIEGVVFFTLRLLLNKALIRRVRNLICARKTVPRVPVEDEDEDVATEDMRVSSGAARSDILQVNKLTKVYRQLKAKVYAVKRISVGIPAGECFGLLGVNGAGKTTTFKMLTGDVSPTDGTAQIKDWDGRLVDIMECRDKGINIGYCPQVDALDSLLTGEEHLYFYARVRGISKKEMDGVVNYLLKRLELNYHRTIISDSYSCGTRRKLSTALALIGHPQILLLDEPSSGMDPRTKRHLWKIISEEVKGRCAVVLTSHSMEECEALCSRLAIMVKGQFRCLGSLQHIKNRFGSGFTVKMYLATASCDAAAITGFMQRQFPSTYLKDQHSNMVEYHIPIAPGGVADIFDQLESNKNALQIKHFSVSQTTLDEVFINFATGKIGMETSPTEGEDKSNDPDAIKAAPKLS